MTIIRHSLIFTTIFFVVYILSGCAGAGDWEVKLPNNYEIWHINSKEIKVVDVHDNNAEIIPSFVKEFTYDSRYVYTCNIDSIDNNNIFSEKFYILDTETKEVYGPYQDTKQLKVKAVELGIDIPEVWYRT